MNRSSGKFRSKPAAIFRDRSFQTLLFAILLIGLLGNFPRPIEVSRTYESQMFEKLSWESDADVVLAGNSRTLRGLCPEDLSNQLGGRRVLNFGFSGAGYSTVYLDAIERVLDPNSAQRTIVLELSPQALTPRFVKQNDFEQTRVLPTRYEASKRRMFDGLLSFMKPHSPRCLIDATIGNTFEERKDVLKQNGWIETTAHPYREELNNNYFRNSVFNQNQVCREVVSLLLTRVKRWSETGICVCGLRVPTSQQVLMIEESLCGLDRTEFIKQFSAAGGQWIELPNDEFQSYDGSHLDAANARKYSRRVGQMITRRESVAAEMPARTFR
jgi:hypothetical protein